jgi:hypothetical protein
MHRQSTTIEYTCSSGDSVWQSSLLLISLTKSTQRYCAHCSKTQESGVQSVILDFICTYSNEFHDNVWDSYSKCKDIVWLSSQKILTWQITLDLP